MLPSLLDPRPKLHSVRFSTNCTGTSCPLPVKPSSLRCTCGSRHCPRPPRRGAGRPGGGPAEPGEPEVTLSPLRYHYQHRAEIEAVVQGATRDAAFDTLCASVGAAIAADRTLGGLCDWVEAEAPRPVDLPVEGAATLKAAVIPVVLHYSTADPLA